MHGDSSRSDRRWALDAIARALRTYGLTDPGAFGDDVIGLEHPSTAAIKGLIRRHHLLLPPGVGVGLVAGTIASEIGRDRPSLPSEPDLEMSVWEIDEFGPFQHSDISGIAAPLSLLEDDIEARLSDLLEVVHQQGHNPTETSDLLGHGHVSGQQTTIACLLKGRSVSVPMQPKHAGKNGDQIPRLFDAPASVFLVQHVHEITEGARRLARQHASFLRYRGQSARVVFMDWRATARIMCGSVRSEADR